MENEQKKSGPLEVENHRLLMHFLQALIKEQNLHEVPVNAFSPQVAMKAAELDPSASSVRSLPLAAASATPVATLSAISPVKKEKK